MASLSGSRIGRYKVGELIGVGGFAAVYEGRDEGLDADVAIKVLADHVSLDPDTRVRFLNEGRLMRKVDHAGVLTVHDVGETDSLQPYLVLQKVEGGSLADRLDQPGASVTGNDLRRAATMLASALEALHNAGIVHRDLSPGNVLLTGSPGAESFLGAGEQLILGDLGLAKDLSVHSGMTSGGGTNGFAAPEQLLPATTVTTAADIYGASALIAHLAERSTDSALKRRVERALEAGLSAEPSERPASIKQWRTMVLDAIDGHDEPVPSSRGLLPVLLGVAVLAVAAIASLMLLSDRSSDELDLLLFSETGVATSWRDQSWGEFDEDTALASLSDFGAVSFITDRPHTPPSEHFVVARLTNVVGTPDVGLRINAADGTELAVCNVLGTELMDIDGTDVRISVPSTLLGDYEAVSRVAIMDRADSAVEFTLEELAIYRELGNPPPSSASCG